MQIRRRRMKMRLLDVCAVFLVAFLAWFATFVMECYYHGIDSEGKQEYGHFRDHLPPFPGDKDENIFWFLQVRLVDKPHPPPISPAHSVCTLGCICISLSLSLFTRFQTSTSAMLITWQWLLISSVSARKQSPSSLRPLY